MDDCCGQSFEESYLWKKANFLSRDLFLLTVNQQSNDWSTWRRKRLGTTKSWRIAQMNNSFFLCVWGSPLLRSNVEKLSWKAISSEKCGARFHYKPVATLLFCACFRKEIHSLPMRDHEVWARYLILFLYLYYSENTAGGFTFSLPQAGARGNYSIYLRWWSNSLFDTHATPNVGKACRNTN